MHQPLDIQNVQSSNLDLCTLGRAGGAQGSERRWHQVLQDDVQRVRGEEQDRVHVRRVLCRPHERQAPVLRRRQLVPMRSLLEAEQTLLQQVQNFVL